MMKQDPADVKETEIKEEERSYGAIAAGAVALLFLGTVIRAVMS